MDLEKLLEKFEDDWSREGGRLNDAAFFSLKLLFVLNGGALLALFAFLSALIGSILSSNKLHIVAPLLDQVRDLSLIWLTGLSLALFATLFMYFTFRFNMRILQKVYKERGLNILDAPEGDFYTHLHNIFTFLAIVFGVASAGCVLWGLFELSSSLVSLKELITKP